MNLHPPDQADWLSAPEETLVQLALTQALGRDPTETECQQGLQDLRAAGTRSRWMLQLWRSLPPGMAKIPWLSRRQRWALRLERCLKPWLGARLSRIPVQKAERAIVLHALAALPIEGLRSGLRHQSALRSLSELPSVTLHQLVQLQPSLQSLSELPLDTLRQLMPLQPALTRLSGLSFDSLQAMSRLHEQRQREQAQHDELDRQLAHYYLAFEDACRTPSDQLMAHFRLYDAWIDGLPASSGQPVLDIGCGRGEWLQYLLGKGHAAQGIDLNADMVARCQSQGLEVRQQDAIEALQSMDEATLIGISAFHVAEHLDFTDLYLLVAQAHRVLVSGGKLLLETPNPENVLVGSHTFYHDPTHRNPLTPTALTFLLQFHGFADIEIVRSNPYPHEAKVPGNDPLTERVNGHLCGPQDFALLARKP